MDGSSLDNKIIRIFVEVIQIENMLVQLNSYSIPLQMNGNKLIKNLAPPYKKKNRYYLIFISKEIQTSIRKCQLTFQNLL